MPGTSSQTKPESGAPASESLQRRDFLARAAALGLSAAGLTAFLGACSRVSATMEPTPTVSASPTGTAAPSAPALAPTATATPFAVATPVPTPTPAPTPVAVAARPAPVPTRVAQTPAGLTERERVAHLLRRAGFGPSVEGEEMDRFARMGTTATVDYLVDYEKTDDSELDTRLASFKFDTTKIGDIQRGWLLRMAETRRPLQEKMTLFWHGLLTSAVSKVGRPELMHQQNQLLREHALDTYDVILKAISRDPAMLVWLDNRANRKGAPNENYARELMELFTLGVGNYTEQDVKEAARAFTGWTVDRDLKFAYNKTQHDSGVKSFLGKRGNFDGDDIVDIILEQPAASRYIVRRLWSFFAYPNPEPELVDRLAGTFRDSRYSVKAVVKEMLLSKEFYSDRAYRALVKSPVDYVVGAARVLGVKSDGAELVGQTNRMGQSLFNPPNVAGWPGGAAWINSATLIQRLNFVNRIALARGGAMLFRPDRPVAQLQLRTPYKAADYYIGLLLDGRMPDEEREVLRAYSAYVAQWPGPGGWVGDEPLRSLVYLVMASPDYQLA